VPIYEYECEACGHRFERIQKFSDPPVETCPNCGKGKVRKLFSSPAIQFKGTGWYITDYARKSEDSPKTSDVPAKPKEGESPASKTAEAATSSTPASSSTQTAPAAPKAAPKDS
jgi:putative FmdB family regulatory protein